MALPERVRRVLPYFGYVAFYLITFVLACYFSFPYEKLRDRIVAEVSNQPKRPGSSQVRLEIDDLGPSWLTGIRATGVRLIVTPRAPVSVNEAEKPPQVFEFDEVRARIGLLARLFGTTKVSFWAKAFGGEIEGVFSDAADERKLELALHDISLSRIDPVTAALSAPVGGSVKGEINLTMPEKKLAKASGNIALACTDLAVGNGTAKLLDALALPRLNVGELNIEGEVKEGVLRFSKFATTGGDVDVVAEGKITLREQPAESLPDLYLRFKFGDTYRAKNDQTKALLGDPAGGGLPPAFEMMPKVKSSKRTDGFYGWHMTGMLQNPRFDSYASTPPASVTGGGSTAGGTPASPNTGRVLPSLRSPTTATPVNP